VVADNDFDVIVIGGGGAGLAAALTAASGGAAVCLVESQPRVGGSTALSGGGFYAAGTSIQRGLGIEDSPEDAFHYYRVLNHGRVDVAVVRHFFESGPATLDWLISLGVPYEPALLDNTGLDRRARTHYPQGGGATLVTVLEHACRDQGVTIAVGNHVDELVLERGVVAGIRIGDEITRCGALVLAAGGYARNVDFLHRHFPIAAAAGDWYGSVAGAGSVGDSIRLGEQVGADLTGENKGMVAIAPSLGRPGRSARYIHVDRHGRRFANEGLYFTMKMETMAMQDGPCFAIFDEGMRAEIDDGPVPDGALSARDLPLISWTAVGPAAAQTCRVYQGSTAEVLAGRAGFDPVTFKGTLDRWNADCREGVDRQFGQDNSRLRAIDRPPFFAVEVRPAVVVLTGYGCRVDAEARVLDRGGHPIAGLFAGGEATGNVLGEMYLGSGNGVASAIIFGRIAGASALRHSGINAGAAGAAPAEVPLRTGI
jgi:fumarate reductase flavoprotein subunit